jgi:hypothetical protein
VVSRTPAAIQNAPRLGGICVPMFSSALIGSFARLLSSMALTSTNVSIEDRSSGTLSSRL